MTMTLNLSQKESHVLTMFCSPPEEVSLNTLVSEAFVWFFVEIVGHYSLHMYVNEKGERVFQREPFRKSHTSRSVRQFLDLFMETQMFAGFTQDRELRKSVVKGKGEHQWCLVALVQLAVHLNCSITYISKKEYN